MCVLTATFGPEAVERCKDHYPALFQKTMDNLLHLIFVRLRAEPISETWPPSASCVNSNRRLTTPRITSQKDYSIVSETDRKAKRSALVKMIRNKASYNRNNAQVALIVRCLCHPRGWGPRAAGRG